MDLNLPEIRSMNSEVKVLVVVKNITGRDVDVIWINFNGLFVKYNVLPRNGYINLTTYETHPWIAVDSETKDRLWINKQFVYMPIAWWRKMGEQEPDSSNLNYRICTTISFPLHSLKYAALLKVRSFLDFEEDVNRLQLPKLLKEQLKVLIRERSDFS